MSEQLMITISVPAVGDRETDAITACRKAFDVLECDDEQALRVLNYLVDRVSAALREPAH